MNSDISFLPPASSRVERSEDCFSAAKIIELLAEEEASKDCCSRSLLCNPDTLM